MDELTIHGLEVSALIGVRDWERYVRQRLLIDLTLEIDTARAAASDSLGDAVDYGAVARRVREIAERNEAQLIETLAERLATTVCNEFQVRRVRLTLHKPGAVPNARDVAITIERTS